MPYITFTPAALADLGRLRAFLGYKNPRAAREAADKIIESIKQLEKFPQIGRPVPKNIRGERELVIDYGQYGYIARYRVTGDQVIVLALRHGREAGY